MCIKKKAENPSSGISVFKGKSLSRKLSSYKDLCLGNTTLPFSQAYSVPIRTPCLSPRSIMSFHLNQGLVDSPLTWSIKAFGRDMNEAGYVAKINAVAFSPATSNFPSAKAMSPSMEDRAWGH